MNTMKSKIPKQKNESIILASVNNHVFFMILIFKDDIQSNNSQVSNEDVDIYFVKKIEREMELKKITQNLPYKINISNSKTKKEYKKCNECTFLYYSYSI